MQFEEMGNMSGKTLMLLPGTCCDWQGFAIAFGLMVWIGAYDTLFWAGICTDSCSSCRTVHKFDELSMKRALGYSLSLSQAITITY